MHPPAWPIVAACLWVYSRPTLARFALSSLVALSLLACANASTNPSQEIDPTSLGGNAGSAGSSAGQGGGSLAGQGGTAGSAAKSGTPSGGQASGQGGSAAGSAGQPGGGQGGLGGVSGGASGAGASGEAGSAQGGAPAGGQAGSAPGGAGSGPFGGQAGQGEAGASGDPFGGGIFKNCPSDVGAAGNPPAPSGTPGGYCSADKLGNPNDDGCYTCWNAAREGTCKAQFDACSASAPCLEFAACWSGCASDEDKCFKKCTDLVPAGAAPYGQVRQCVYAKACPSECVDQCKGIGSANRCNHGVCTTGYDLDPDCNECAAKVCATDSICCNLGWDSSCRTKAEKVCQLDCDAPPAGCVHSECATGARLDPACSPCATKVCAQYPICCQPFGRWDIACALAADELCAP